MHKKNHSTIESRVSDCKYIVEKLDLVKFSLLTEFLWSKPVFTARNASQIEDRFFNFFELFTEDKNCLSFEELQLDTYFPYKFSWYDDPISVVGEDLML